MLLRFQKKACPFLLPLTFIYSLNYLPPPTTLLFSGERVQGEIDAGRPEDERWAGVNCVSQTALPLWGEGLVWTNNRVPHTQAMEMFWGVERPSTRVSLGAIQRLT